MTCQVPEAKKSWIPLKVLAITKGFFLLGTRRETRGRRSLRARTPRTQRRSACRQRSPSYAFILGEIGQEVKGAGNEDRFAEAAGTAERLDRILNRLDQSEVRTRPLGQVRRGERPAVTRGRGDQPLPQGREGREHSVHVLVRQDRGDDDVGRTREAWEHVAQSGQVVSAVPDLEGIVAQPLEPARQLYVHVAVDWTAEERLGGGHGEGEVAAAGDDDRLGAVLAGELPPLRLADHHGRAGLDDRELL